MTLSTKEAAALELVKTIADTIRDLGSVPSGHLYLRVMNRIPLKTYDAVIDVLVKTSLVRRDPSHLLTWIGGGR